MKNIYVESIKNLGYTYNIQYTFKSKSAIPPEIYDLLKNIEWKFKYEYSKYNLYEYEGENYKAKLYSVTPTITGNINTLKYKKISHKCTT